MPRLMAKRELQQEQGGKNHRSCVVPTEKHIGDSVLVRGCLPASEISQNFLGSCCARKLSSKLGNQCGAPASAINR
jgi:hypothetical protein